ncbi:MAG: 50S ribosome-binding GTPase, partial [Clostridia bacterium]|nr:50S ribosome-binding GTPase [Clostridia bacterium]
MDIRIALAGNPNCGKTTLFNALTGSNQYVGNWPGVTVEKKEGKLKNHDDVTITDLPGIYSLSPYTLEEVVARNYLIGEQPDAVLNIVDGTNLERNLYLTTQVVELGIPTVVAINMMDVVEKNGDEIDIRKLAKALGTPVVEISALKGTGVTEAAEAAIKVAKEKMVPKAQAFSEEVEGALKKIESIALADIPEEQRRWYAVKLFERDDKVLSSMGLSNDNQKAVEEVVAATETSQDDDAESIITNERYMKIGDIISD